MDRIENRKNLASPIQIKITTNWIWKLKPNANKKSQFIMNTIVDPHALMIVYKHIKSKLRNMTPRGDEEQKTFWRGGERKPFFLGINRRWFEHTAKWLRMRKYPFKPTRQMNIPKPTSQSWLFLNCRILQNGRGGCCNKGHKNLKVIRAHEINLVHYSMKSLQSSHISLWL